MQEKGLSNTETYFMSFVTLVLESYLLPALMDFFFSAFLSLLRVYSGQFHNPGYGSKRFAPPTSCVNRQK